MEELKSKIKERSQEKEGAKFLAGITESREMPLAETGQSKGAVGLETEEWKCL